MKSFIKNLYLFFVAVFATNHVATAQVGSKYNRGEITITAISDLFDVPEYWQEIAPELSKYSTRLWEAGVVQRKADFDKIASGPGVSARLPFFKPMRIADEVQQEHVAPTPGKVTSSEQWGVIFRRSISAGATALSGSVTGMKPWDFINANIVSNRTENRVTTFLSELDGVFADKNKANGFGDLILDTTKNDGTGEAFGAETLIDAVTLVGDQSKRFQDCVLVMHSKVHASLKKQNLIDFVKPSEGSTELPYYQGKEVVIDDRLVKNGPNGSKIYTTYLVAKGAFNYGEKPQVIGKRADASIQFIGDGSLNEDTIIDRTVFILHPEGASFRTVGNGANNPPATGVAGGYSDEEVAAATWDLVVDKKWFGAICVRTNG